MVPDQKNSSELDQRTLTYQCYGYMCITPGPLLRSSKGKEPRQSCSLLMVQQAFLINVTLSLLLTRRKYKLVLPMRNI